MEGNDGFALGDHPERVSMKDFALIKVLGKGAYGKVFLVRRIGGTDNGHFYAMKVLKKERLIGRQKSLEHVLMERTVLEKLCSGNCPFLVNLIYAFQSETKLHIVMEYVSGGELFTHLCKRRFFPVESARVLLGELALALKFIHSFNVAYRDLKLENILIEQHGHIKLTDFGLSKAYKEEMDTTNSYCGTVEYMAPEVIKRVGYTKVVDWWSFGVIVFELLTGCSPFTVDGDRNSAQEVAKRVLSKAIPFPKSMDQVSRNFISALLERNPEKRLGNGGFGEIKNHDFFKNVDWDLLEKRKLESPIKPIVSNPLDVNNFAVEFTKLKPILTPAECPSSFQSLFRGYSFVPPSVFFERNNTIGEEISESLDELTKNSPFFSKYEISMGDDGFLGRGTFSVCRKCRRLEDGKEFAVKIVSQRFAFHALREIRMLEQVNPHKNIVKFEEALCDPLHYYLVEELLEGGQLLKRLRTMTKFTEAHACKLMNQLVSAVAHIHRKGAVHRDLKPENIIFANEADDAELKLVDFGFARLLPNNSLELNTPCFTLEYAAPEVLEIEDDILPQYNQQCDLWSLGVILFTMLSGKVPFNARSTNQTANDIISKIKTAEFSFEDPVWDSVSDLGKSLITGLLTVDPKKRLKIGQVIRHPWLRDTSSSSHVRELQTPTILPEIDDKFNETINAFMDGMNRNEFQLLDVETAPLLVKRRGMKRRSESVTKKRSISGNNLNCPNNKVATKLMVVPEDESIPAKRPTTLDIEMDMDTPDSARSAFTEIRDTKPDDLKFSQDIDAATSKNGLS